jgi:uncharacterized protein YbjQ (UPF0145 family)
MIITTTNTIEGRPVNAYRGIVMGEAIIGANIDHEVLGKAGSMLMVTSAGTAVGLSGEAV